MFNKNPFDPQPTVLTGRYVRLEPLELRHADELFGASQDTDIWRYMPIRMPQSPQDMLDWIRTTLADHERGHEIPFATIDLHSRQAVGSTRFMDIRRSARGLEIGWTWLGTAFHRTPINTECKWLLLQHAFESLGAARVQLKTDGRNERSQRAIERIGAVREGLHRKHRLCSDGEIRDSVFYSIIDTDWPIVKSRLCRLLDRSSSAAI